MGYKGFSYKIEIALGRLISLGIEPKEIPFLQILRGRTFYKKTLMGY